MKTLIVGDLHGKWEIAEKALSTEHNVVFMGDYLDSFERSSHDCLKTLSIVTEAEHGVYALKGNHELSYLGMPCSGYNKKIASGLWLDWEMTLLDCLWCEGFLISHAGVSQLLLDSLQTDLEGYLNKGSYEQVGVSRGGTSHVGGLYWCDWFQEFSPVEGVKQIVGHSGYRPGGVYEGILEKEGNYNVDCLDYKEQFLLIENGEAEVITL